MKFVLITIIFLMTACGSLRDNCRLGDQACRTLLGASDFESDSNLSDLTRRVEANEKDIKSLQSLVTALYNSVFNIEQNIVQNQSLISALQTQVGSLNTSQTTQDSTIAALQASVAGLTAQLASLQGSQGTQDSSIASLQATITALNAQIVVLQSGQGGQGTSITSLLTSVANLTAVNNNQNTLLTSQQTQINNAVASIAVLEGYNNIVSIKDVCGDKAGVYDEVFLVLSTGEMLSSFSDNVSGLNTRFSKLTPGSFVSTDNSFCYFSVVADAQPGKPNQVKIINEHY